MSVFSKEVFIRLADDYATFTCTLRYGRIYSKTTDFSVNDGAILNAADGVAAVPINSRPSNRMVRQETYRSDD